MALRDPAPISQPDNTNLIAGVEGRRAEQSDGKLVTRTGAVKTNADSDILNYDLGDSDFNLSSSKDEGASIDVGGTGEVLIGVESEEDRQFSVTVIFLDEDDNELFTIDQNKDSDLLSTTGSSTNHHVATSISIFGDRFNITITDESGSTVNTINGTVNAH